MEISYPELRYIRVYAVPIEEVFAKQEEKEEIGIAIIITDITEDKVSLEERIESERVACIMDLAAGVAHELREPAQFNPYSFAGITQKFRSRKGGSRRSQKNHLLPVLMK